MQLRRHRRSTLALIAAVSLAGGLVSAIGAAGAAKPPTSATVGGSYTSQWYLHQIAFVQTPAPYVNSASFDISWVDSKTQTYYLADRTNNGILSINAANNTFGSVIGAGSLVGTNKGAEAATPAQVAACGPHGEGGPNGVVSFTVGGVGQVAAGDGVGAANPVSSVKVYTLSSPTTGTLGASISTADSAFGTAGVCRADEMAYDPAAQMLIVANDLDAPPYLSLISMNANPALDTVVGQIKLPNATGGIEQPIYDQQTKLFYVNVPDVGIVVISPTTKSLVKTFPIGTNCPAATGLALDPQTQDMLVGCGINPSGSLIMDTNGKVDTQLSQVSGPDEVWFDPGTNHFYLGASSMTSTGAKGTGYVTPVMGVLATDSSGAVAWQENVPYPPGRTASIAADATNGEVFVPMIGLGVAVFGWAKHRITHR